MAYDLVRYRELTLDEPLEPQDQFLALDEPEWQIIKMETVGRTPRRYAAVGTVWRRPYFECDPLFVELLSKDERRVGDMRARRNTPNS